MLPARLVLSKIRGHALEGVFLAGLAVAAGGLGCGDERPPKPSDGAASAAQPTDVYLEPGQRNVVLTFAGERGAFQDTNDSEKIPEDASGLVRVTLLEGPDAPPGTVWVANLLVAEPDGRFKLTTVPRELFEELALGRGRKSAVELPEGLEPPKHVANTGEIIVYKTDWCGVCKKLLAYLDRKGVRYLAKDVEKDRAAASELAGKARAKGIQANSVPVIDVGGELMVGFDRARLEQLL